jgi:DNA-binding transcriptional LysR family regulator
MSWGDLDYNDVAVFTEVVRQRGFAAAGRALGLPGSAVSRRVSRLEERVGTRLLQRTTRSVGLTEAGRRFYEHTARVQDMVAEGVRAIALGQSTPTGTVRVTAPPDDAGVIWALLSGYLHDHPRVDLVVEHTLEKVDMVAQNIDVALRGGPPPDTDLYIAHRLFDSRILLAASPAYLSLRGVPERVEELSEHDGVCMDAWAPNAIRRVRGDRSYVRVQVRNRIVSNSLQTAQRAALDGHGIAPLLELTCQRELDSGALVEVLPGALPDSAPFWAITPLGKERSAAATALLAHVTDRAARLRATGAW